MELVAGIMIGMAACLAVVGIACVFRDIIAFHKSEKAYKKEVEKNQLVYDIGVELKLILNEYFVTKKRVKKNG